MVACRRQATVLLWLQLALDALGKWPGSQGDQDVVLQDLFYGRIGTTNRFAVEFGGCPGVPGSNTLRLRANNTPPLRVEPQYASLHTPWDALLLEGSQGCKPHAKLLKPHRTRNVVKFANAWIGSDTIVNLFTEHGVPHEVDYVSIDLDTVDLWVLKSLIGPASPFKPRALTIEYNGNFGAEGSITMPDPATMPSSRYNFTKEHMNHPMSREKMYPAALCYQGATARAIEQVANANGYVIVNKSLGYDLYLVRRELWRWPVPKLEELQIEKCMNAPMSPQMAVNLLDYGVYSSLTSTPGGGGGGGGVAAGGREAAHAGSHHGRSGPRANLRALCKANREAAKVLARLATTSKCGCFKHMAEPLPESEACRALAGLPADTRSGGYYHGERPWENRG